MLASAVALWAALLWCCGAAALPPHPPSHSPCRTPSPDLLALARQAPAVLEARVRSLARISLDRSANFSVTFIIKRVLKSDPSVGLPLKRGDDVRVPVTHVGCGGPLKIGRSYVLLGKQAPSPPRLRLLTPPHPRSRHLTQRLKEALRPRSEVPLSNPNIREARTSTPLEMTGEETEYMTSAPVLIEIQNEESEYMASAPVQNEVINFMASAPVVEVQNEDETNHYTPNSWTNRRRPKILSTHERSEVIEKSQTLEAFIKNYIEREDARASELHSISMKIKEEELAKAIQERKTEEVKTKIQEEILKKIQGRPPGVVGLQAKSAAEGEVVRLTCQARGRPPPALAWYRNGLPIPPQHLTPNPHKRIRLQTKKRRSMLVISRALLEDSGVYECRAVAEGASPSFSRATLSVQRKITTDSSKQRKLTTDSVNSGAPCPMPDPSSFCLNGGTCLFFEAVREPACKCPEGFKGQRCENKDVNGSSMYHSFECTLGAHTSYYC